MNKVTKMSDQTDILCSLLKQYWQMGLTKKQLQPQWYIHWQQLILILKIVFLSKISTINLLYCVSSLLNFTFFKHLLLIFKQAIIANTLQKFKTNFFPIRSVLMLIDRKFFSFVLLNFSTNSVYKIVFQMI